MSFSLKLYNLALILFSPLILGSYFLKVYSRPDYRERWAERLGQLPPAKQKGGLHIHAVSLGEAKVAAKVVDELRRCDPKLPVVFTCSTATASQFIRNQYGQQVDHCYLPLDYPWIVADFLDSFQPRLCAITEVEWWPNLITLSAQKGIPVVMINAKMNADSAATYARFGPLFRAMARKVNRVLCQNHSSQDLFAQLGLKPEQLQVTNNIKFDEQPPPALPQAIENLKAAIGHRPVWIAGSTHAEDEEVVLDAFARVKAQCPELILILVPRHPERFDEAADECSAQGFQLARRSLQQMPDADTDILLGDTLGELAALYGIADIAFIGGSITDRGGHNPLEAAIYGIPMLMGPSHYNANDSVEQLADAGALKVIQDAESMVETLLSWLQAPEQRQQAGHMSAQVITDNQGALAATTAYLQQLLNPKSTTDD